MYIYVNRKGDRMVFKRRNKDRRACKQCTNSFVQNNYNQVFCSGKCRNDFFNDQKAEAMDIYRKTKELNKKFKKARGQK